MLCIVMTSGCAVANPRTTPTVATSSTAPFANSRAAAGAAVRMRFTPPRDVYAVRTARDTIVLHQASALLGRVDTSIGDTLVLSTAEVQMGLETQSLPRGTKVAVVRGNGLTIEVINQHPGRAELVTLVVIPAIILGALAWLVRMAGD
jgi:hypothetical protein